MTEAWRLNYQLPSVFPDSLPQLSLGTAALIIFVLCAGFVLLRGMTRMLVGTLVLGLSAWIGFQVWQMAPGWAVDWTGKSSAWLTNGLPIAAFLSSFWILRLITNAVVRPFSKPSEKSTPRSFGSALFRLVFALIPTLLIGVIVATIAHHRAAVADVRASSDPTGGAGKPGADSFSQRLTTAVQRALPEKWLGLLDPLADSSRLALAKLIAAQAETPPQPTLDPQTGKPIPRAIIVADPALQQLARDGNFDTLLRHPLLTKALADPKIQKLLHDLSR